MNKVKRKKIFTGIIVVVTIMMITTIFAGINFGNKKGSKKEDTGVVAQVYKAQLGCAMKVDLTDKGKKDYKNASKCMVLVENKQMSSLMNFGEKFTVFPAKKSKEAVTIKLFSKDNKEVGTVNVNLEEGK